MNAVPRVRVGEIEMAYEEQGEGERPFVLVHGFTGSRDDFVDVLPALARHGHTVLVDQRGHGESTNTGRAAGYDLDQLVRDLLGFLDARGHERVDLLGHSMGGMMAVRFALTHPERVASLVLMDTSARPVNLLTPVIRQVAARLGRAFGMRRIAKGMRRAASHDRNRAPSARACEERMGSDRFWQRIETKLEQMDPEAFVHLGRSLGQHESAVPRLGEIACPTLVIVGAEDRPFLEPSEEMARAIADSTHVVVSDAAHSPQFENPDAWLAAIEAHLRRARVAAA